MVDQGRVAYHEHNDADIREALAVSLEQAERGRRHDKRLMVLYVLIVVVFASSFGYMTHQQRVANEQNRQFRAQIVRNCEANRQGDIKFNQFITSIQRAVRMTRTLTPAEKAERIAFYEAARVTVPVCPPPSFK